MQQKNSALTEAVNQAKAELRSVERDKASLEDEKRRLQTQLTNLQRQLASTEASIESGNQVFIAQVFSKCLAFIDFNQLFNRAFAISRC